MQDIKRVKTRSSSEKLEQRKIQRKIEEYLSQREQQYCRSAGSQQ